MARASLFQTIREILGRGLSQSETAAIDAELDAIGVAKVNAQADKPSTIGPAGIALIQQFEGLAKLRGDGRVEAYPDPGTGGDPWTIGWGATGHDIDGRGRIEQGTVWSREQADVRLVRDLKRYADEVARALGNSPRSQSQFDAMVSFHYNTGAIGRATLTKKHKAGDYVGSAAEFARWNRAGGRVLRGLSRRRAAEAELYRS
ncbi:lysozyme [Erythrobacter sp. W53]|uniref:lysozyme n=1 Tax=Erythrobacter sp. W53 TaxID=3425947 RepID=UPI003D76846A